MRKDFKDLKKNCEYCGKEMRRKKFGNRYEDANVFLKRKYCDRECMRKGFLNVGKNNSSWSATHESARNINNLILNKNQCEKCGTEKGQLDIHHKDFNENNNELDNLICLCRSCHTKIHRPAKKCSVTGCNDKVKGHGYCEKHYQRFRKYGNPYTVKWNTKHTKYDADVIFYE